MNKPPRIGFFDSGIGGLSVLRHAPRRIGNAGYLYVADSGYAPYGRQAPAKVLERSLMISRFLEQAGVDAIVIACNTATALAADAIRAELSVPVVAMEPAIKPAMANSASGTVAVLATAGTLNSERYRLLKQRHGRDGVLIERACHHWVEALEEGRLAREEIASLVEAELHDIRATGADTYILACTHFPFLLEPIRDAVGRDAAVIDPAPAVIEQLARRLGIEAAAVADPTAPPMLQLYTSGDPARLTDIVKRLLGWDLGARPLPTLLPLGRHPEH